MSDTVQSTGQSNSPLSRKAYEIIGLLEGLTYKEAEEVIGLVQGAIFDSANDTLVDVSQTCAHVKE